MQRVEMPLGRYTLSFETGRMAKQSDGAVVVRLGRHRRAGHRQRPA